jgi:K+ transporter
MAVMLVTTAFVTVIMVIKWSLSLLLVVPFAVFFVFVEAVFLSSNLFKVWKRGVSASTLVSKPCASWQAKEERAGAG